MIWWFIAGLVTGAFILGFGMMIGFAFSQMKKTENP